MRQEAPVGFGRLVRRLERGVRPEQPSCEAGVEDRERKVV